MGKETIAIANGFYHLRHANGYYRSRVSSSIWPLRTLVGLCFLLLAGAAIAAPLRVSVVLPVNEGAYAEFVAALKASRDLPNAQEISVSVITFPASGPTPTPLKLPPTDLVVAVGSKSTNAVLHSNIKVPILSALVPRLTYEELLRNANIDETDAKNLSVVFIDQPIERQLQLIKIALPQVDRLAVLLGPVSASLADEARKVAAEYNIDLNIHKVYDNTGLASGLKKAIEHSDALLTLADPLVYNRYTIQNVLLATYRRRLPVVGFSQAYINAGALLGVYSTPAQIGQQVAALIEQYHFSDRKTLPARQYPTFYSVAVNRHVAQSLGLTIENEAYLLLKLEQHPTGAGL